MKTMKNVRLGNIHFKTLHGKRLTTRPFSIAIAAFVTRIYVDTFAKKNFSKRTSDVAEIAYFVFDISTGDIKLKSITS